MDIVWQTVLKRFDRLCTEIEKMRGSGGLRRENRYLGLGGKMQLPRTTQRGQVVSGSGFLRRILDRDIQ
jgi:hypothetical protein